MLFSPPPQALEFNSFRIVADLDLCIGGAMGGKSYPSHISISQLAELSGRDRRTVTDRLKALTPVEVNATGNLFEIRAAIRLVFDFNPDDDAGVEFRDDFQPMHEKSKLDFFKRQAVELELDIKRRNVIPKEEIAEGLAAVFVALRSKILAFPRKAAQQVPPEVRTIVENVLKKNVDEALVELSEERVYERS